MIDSLQTKHGLASQEDSVHRFDEGSVIDTLHHHVTASPNRIAYRFIDSEETPYSITYRELFDRSRQIAEHLLHFAEPGDRALLMYPPGIEFIEAFFGCLCAGVIAVPAYPPKKNRNTERIIAIAQDCRPRLMLCTREISKNLSYDFAERVGSTATVTTDVYVPIATSALPTISKHHTAFLQYTSGSTATPKGVIVSHGNIIANERLIQRHFDFNKSSVMVSWLPMFHDMGLIGGVLAPFFVGFPSVLMAPNTFLRDPFRWLDTISKYKATCTGSPNFGYDLCTRRISDNQKRSLDLSSLKIAYNGAEPVCAETIKNFSNAFAECGFHADAFFPCYGMAESTLLVSGGPPLNPTSIVRVSSEGLERHAVVEEELGQPIVSCGQVTSDLEVRIVHPETKTECSCNQIGEVWIHGASVAQGYVNLADETKAAFQAKLHEDTRHWLRSGDYGFLRDGQLYITGRLKDVIIIRGRNIYPQDIEACVYSCFNLESANSVAAVQLPFIEGPSIGIIAEATRLMYQQSREWKRDHSETALAQKEEFKRKMQRLKQLVSQRFDVSLTHIAFVKPGRFPRTSSGKVMRSRCLQDFLRKREEYLPLPMASVCADKENAS